MYQLALKTWEKYVGHRNHILVEPGKHIEHYIQHVLYICVLGAYSNRTVMCDPDLGTCHTTVVHPFFNTLNMLTQLRKGARAGTCSMTPMNQRHLG